jgi:hypothetical protein
MRLRDLRSIIAINTNKFTCALDGVPGNNSLRNVNKYIDAIEATEEYKLFGIFPSLTNQLSSIKQIYSNRTGSVVLDVGTANAFQIAIEQLRAASIAILEMIDSAIPKQESNSISIKLPQYNNLNDLSVFFEKLNQVINQGLVNDYVKGDVKLQNFDSGSFWIEIIIASQFALNLFTGIVWASAVIAKKIMEVQILEQQLRGLEIRNDLLGEISESAKKKIDVVLEAETQHLLSQLNIEPPDPEYNQRLMHSVETLAELILKGTEIHPSLSAPEEVKNLLPDFKSLTSIVSKIKQLESKSINNAT